MADIKKFLSFDVFQTNEQWIHDYIDQKDAASIKVVSLSSDGRKMEFYKISNPTSTTQPAYSLEIPLPSLDGVMMKLGNATVDNVATLTSEGAVKDSGISINDLPTTETVTALIAEKISQAAHMKKQIVTELPNPEDADENTFYLIKIDVTGKDKYEVWVLIGNELVLIDDTTVDLSGYVDSNQLTTAVAQAKSEAIADAVATAALDAQSKADAAVASAKQYTDSQVGTLTTTINGINETVAGHTQTLVTINNTLVSHSDRLTELEARDAIEVATTEEALAAFNAIFYPTK